MNEKTILTGKLFEDKLKLGWGWSQMSKELGYGSIEKLREAINKTFRERAAKDIMRRLDKNEKNWQKAQKVAMNRNNHSMKAVAVANRNLEAVVEEEGANLQDDDILAELLKNETELSASICTREAELVALQNRKKKSEEALRKLSSELTTLKQTLENKKSEALKVIEEARKVDSEIKTKKEENCKEMAILEGIRREIEERKIVNIWAYENGDIENSDHLEIPDEWIEIKQKLLLSEELEDFTVRNIGVLAKVLSIILVLKQEERSYEVVFENELLQELFEKEEEKIN